MAELQNINEYNEIDWYNKFTKSALYAQLTKEYDVLWFDKHSTMVSSGTPRQAFADPNPKTFFSATIFYYLEALFDGSAEVVYDIGCGWNIFKKYYPNIIGIGAETPGTPMYYADIHDYVDKIYVDGHQEFFDCFFSINALHFRPIGEIKQIVLECVSMLKPGGTAFITFNSQILVSRETEQNKIKLFENPSPGAKRAVEPFIRQQLYDIDVEWNIVDIDLSVPADGFDGNIRLMFTRKH